MPYIRQNRRIELRRLVDEKIDQNINCNPQNIHLGGVIASILTMNNFCENYFSFSDSENVREIVHILRNRFQNEGESMIGDLNFCVCRFLVGITNIHKEPSYEKINTINRILNWSIYKVNNEWKGRGLIWERAISIIDDIKLELYRRYAGPYEDKKMIDNGDIMD